VVVINIVTTVLKVIIYAINSKAMQNSYRNSKAKVKMTQLVTLYTLAGIVALKTYLKN
jgi:hypothetical protein